MGRLLIVPWSSGDIYYLFNHQYKNLLIACYKKFPIDFHVPQFRKWKRGEHVRIQEVDFYQISQQQKGQVTVFVEIAPHRSMREFYSIHSISYKSYCICIL